MLAFLRQTQRALERLYDIDTACDVADFVTLKDPRHDRVEEQVLCQLGPDGVFSARLELGLRPLEGLLQKNPFVRLDGLNLPDFCLVLEGVSHFVNLAWASLGQRQICALTLEQAAELDKFLLAVCLWHGQQIGSMALHRALFHRLFVAHTFHPDLSAEARERYARASDGAARIVHSWLTAGVDRNVRQLVLASRRLRRSRRLGF